MKNIIITILFSLTIHGISAQILSTDLIEVKGGTFMMGNGSYARESPVRNVIISTFYISKYTVTNAQFAEFLNAYGSQTVKEGEFAGKQIFKEDSWGIVNNNGLWKAATGFDQYPAVKITWYGANAYCKWAGGRLPTEAEWEYAAKGGINKNAYTYSGSSTANNVAWYYNNSGNQNKQVGTKTANSLGIYDMSGNVYQWCTDWFGRYANMLTSVVDPAGPAEGVSKVIRGGYRSLGTADLHLTHRESLSPEESYNFVGFRLVKNTLTPVERANEVQNILYPNPAKQLVAINFPNDIKNLKIINPDGKLMYDNTINGKIFSVADYPNGIYFIRVSDNKNNFFVQKLVIDR
ncbi:MAG: SUMF1/EgtB/PvdO family nonheme iron enzyme [Paludibacteraceae bacterium]